MAWLHTDFSGLETRLDQGNLTQSWQKQRTGVHANLAHARCMHAMHAAPRRELTRGLRHMMSYAYGMATALHHDCTSVVDSVLLIGKRMEVVEGTASYERLLGKYSTVYTTRLLLIVWYIVGRIINKISQPLSPVGIIELRLSQRLSCSMVTVWSALIKLRFLSGRRRLRYIHSMVELQ